MGLVIMVLFVVLLYYLFSFVFSILSWLTPVMVIAALIINYKVYIDYFQMIMGLVKKNAFLGIATGVMSFMAFPLVAGYLLVKALLFRKIGKMKTDMRTAEEKEYVEYEEVEDEDYVNLEPLDLEPLEKEVIIEKKPHTNEYDDLFK